MWEREKSSSANYSPLLLRSRTQPAPHVCDHARMELNTKHQNARINYIIYLKRKGNIIGVINIIIIIPPSRSPSLSFDDAEKGKKGFEASSPERCCFSAVSVSSAAVLRT